MWAAARLIGTAKEVTSTLFLMPAIMFLLPTEFPDNPRDVLLECRTILFGGLALIGVHVHHGSFFRDHLSQFQRLFLLAILCAGKYAFCGSSAKVCGSSLLSGPWCFCAMA